MDSWQNAVLMTYDFNQKIPLRFSFSILYESRDFLMFSDLCRHSSQPTRKILTLIKCFHPSVLGVSLWSQKKRNIDWFLFCFLMANIMSLFLQISFSRTFERFGCYFVSKVASFPSLQMQHKSERGWVLIGVVCTTTECSPLAKSLKLFKIKGRLKNDTRKPEASHI